MKTKILSFLFVLIGGLFMATSAFADNETNVSLQVAYKYSVTNTSGMKYTWKVYKDAAFTQVASATTDYTATFVETSNTANITWKAATDFWVWVQGTDSKGCYTEPIILKVTAVTETYCISNQTNKTTCSLIAAGSGNNAVNADSFTFDVTISHPSTSGTYTINYNVGTTSGSKTITGVEAGKDKTGTITVSHLDHVNDFTNTTTSAKPVTISITSIKNNSTANVEECATPFTFADITVEAKPVIKFE